MSDRVPAGLSRLLQVTATGESAGGLVRAEVDGTGDLVQLLIDPRAMRLPAADLADEVRRAFQAARAGIREQLDEAIREAGPVAAGVDPELAQVAADAQQRLNELTSMTRDLADRLGRH
jgi:DNA-binding protein YbaB